MENQIETREVIIKIAKEEFLAHGYEKTSLRTICSKAGVTTGAVYYFFSNKEGLFNAVVEPVDKAVKAMILAHLAQEQHAHSKNKIPDPAEDVLTAKQIVHLFYRYETACRILIEKSAGTQYEHFLDGLIDMLEQAACQNLSGSSTEADEWMFHWFAHLQVDSFLQVLLHSTGEKNALRQIERVAAFLRAGWDKIAFQI